MVERLKWADVIIAMANGKEAQWQDFNGDWQEPGIRNPMSHPGVEWRIKPATIKIGDHEISAPIQEAPPVGSCVFFVDLSASGYHWWFRWAETMPNSAHRLISTGTGHLSRDAAIAHARALIAISGGTV